MRNLFCLLLAWFSLGTTPLHAGVYEDILVAANDGRTEEVIGLLRRGLDVNTSAPDGSTLLLIAARNGNLALADFLLTNRASTAKPNRYGDTPILLAASQGHKEMLVRLIDAGAAINAKGWAPLHYAIFSGHLEIAQVLLTRGADSELRAPNGRTALMLGAQTGNAAAVKLLLQTGASPEAKDYDGLTAEAIARQKQFNDVAELLKQK